MKSFINILSVFATAVILFTACTEDISDIRLDPQLATTQSSNVTSSTATVVGFVVAEGDGFTEKGICYSTQAGPTTADGKAVYSGDETTAAFTVTVTGLNYATKYYARAYGMNFSGTFYGEDQTFTTLPVVPTLTTAEITEITGNSATGGGEVTVSGGAEVTVRGVVFGIEPAPTVDNGKTEDDKGTGAFESKLTGLLGNTTYYVRAYATNSAGTGYGPEVSFKTLVDLPVVTTATVTGITKTSAVLGGNVTYDGGGEVTARGVVWGSTENPTLEDNVIDGGTGTGEFSADLTGLEIFTTYHVRAYATNSVGTAYGENIGFTTLANITQFWVVGDYNGWDNSDNAKYIISTPTNNGAAEGYIYLTSGGFKLVTDHSWDDAHTYGDDGSGKLTNPGNNIAVDADGYYLIKASLETMTYSRTKTDWGVVGSATPGDWNTDSPLTYDLASAKWKGVVHLTAAELKFRANNDWDYNYGSTAGDETLDAGGTNIAVDVESDYQIILDLSHPNEYTYQANRWGVIGSATAGGWDSDQNMTWDATNEVFTVTLNLTAGEFKFRANDAWTLDYGDSGADGTLDQGGTNISVAESGNYTITLDLDNGTYALVRN
ncbi:MAG: SusF/SusE family outer membrane protein [Mangrovibacterium sp.]